MQAVVKLPSARAPLATATILAVLAFAVAVFGVGPPPGGGTLAPGTVTVAGFDPTGGTPVPIDLTAPVTVTTSGGAAADTVRLSLQVLGRPVAEQSALLIPAPQGGGAATLPPMVNRYLMAGTLTGELSLLQAGTVTATEHFPIHTLQSATTTAVAAGAVVLALFSAAYLESFLRSLRRGRRRYTASLGAPVVAAALAVAAVAAAWVLTGRPPTTAAVATTVVLAALAGAAAAVGAWRIGRHRRYRRIHRSAPRNPGAPATRPGGNHEFR